MPQLLYSPDLAPCNIGYSSDSKYFFEIFNSTKILRLTKRGWRGGEDTSNSFQKNLSQGRTRSVRRGGTSVIYIRNVLIKILFLTFYLH